MEISKETKQSWLDLMEYGDKRKLAKELNLSEQRVATIINDGKGSVCQIALIHKYFTEKKNQIKIINNLNDE